MLKTWKNSLTENWEFTHEYTSIYVFKIYCLNVASLCVINNKITFSTACLCLSFHSTCLPPHRSSLQLFPFQVLLFLDTVEFSMVQLLPMSPGNLSFLSRTISHSFSFTLSFPQCCSWMWGYMFCRCSTALGDKLTVHIQKREVLVIPDSVITSGITPRGTYFHYSVSYYPYPSFACHLLCIGKHTLSSPDLE